eukprot:754667-Hanusia_phi.AAC.2
MTTRLSWMGTRVWASQKNRSTPQRWEVCLTERIRWELRRERLAADTLRVQDKNRDRCGIGITLHVDDEGEGYSTLFLPLLPFNPSPSSLLDVDLLHTTLLGLTLCGCTRKLPQGLSQHRKHYDHDNLWTSGTFRIISITHGGPADLSGDVLVGDVVTSVDNTPVQGMKKVNFISL